MHIHVHDHFGLILGLLMIGTSVGRFVQAYIKKRFKWDYLSSALIVFVLGIVCCGDATNLRALTDIGHAAVLGLIVFLVARWIYDEVKRTFAGDKEPGAV